MLKPIKRTRLYEGVITQLLELMRGGDLKPGDQLPAERELAEKLHISRSSVREALRALEITGHLESKVGVGGGAYVKKITMENVFSSFVDLMERKENDLLELMEVRLILETGIARLAARRRKERNLKEMYLSLEEMKREILDGKLGLVGNKRFHEAVARATCNEILARVLHMCVELLQRMDRGTLGKLEKPSVSLEGHQRIYGAILEGDGEKASKQMKFHLEHAIRNLRAALSNNNTTQGGKRDGA